MSRVLRLPPRGTVAKFLDQAARLDRAVNRAAAEGYAVRRDMAETSGGVRLAAKDRFGAFADLTIEPHGGGGTAFFPVMRYLDEYGIEPEAGVFLTDLYGSDFGDPIRCWICRMHDHQDASRREYYQDHPSEG